MDLMSSSLSDAAGAIPFHWWFTHAKDLKAERRVFFGVMFFFFIRNNCVFLLFVCVFFFCIEIIF